MGYSDQQIEDLRERADLVAIIGRRVQLQKRGKDYLGLCPFHGERSPSFNVIPGKHFWHCFGCNESGDIFKFFMKLDGLSFSDALKHVAQEAGIILIEEKFDPEEAKRRAHLDDLAALLDRAVKFYEAKLWHPSGKAAQEHLQKRGILKEACEKFHLGFGGAGYSELAMALRKASVPPDLAIEAGLCKPGRNGELYDFFHGRLIIPIRIPRPPDGRTIALGGRYLEGVTDGERGPRPGQKAVKYFNSPETALYKKGSVLFGMDQARDAIRKEERAVIVEGYFDVIGVHQAGLHTAVATCGTALTPAHLDLLTRSAAREIIFLFDGDAAGLRAAARAAEMCAKAQVSARVATLPLGKDPDEFARENGLEALQALLERAKPAVDMLIDKELDELGMNATVEDKVQAVQKVRDVVLASPSEMARNLHFKQIADRLGIDQEAVRKTILSPEKPAARRNPQHSERGPRSPVGPRRDTPQRAPSDQPPPAPSVPPPNPLAKRTLPFEESITIALLRFPVLAAVVAQEGVLASFGNPALRGLADRVIAEQEEGMEIDPARLLEELEDEMLRGRLRRALADPDATIDLASTHLRRVLEKLQAEVDKQRQRSNYLASRNAPVPMNDAELRARLEAEQAELERRRLRHLKKRETDRHT